MCCREAHEAGFPANRLNQSALPLHDKVLLAFESGDTP